MKTNKTISIARPRRRAVCSRPGFTLIELIVVIGVIAAASALAIPTMMTLFSSGADKQAHNLLAAQMTVARAVAIENGTYAGVHVQMEDADEYERDCYSLVTVMNENSGRFEAADNFYPEPMPGKMAFGQVNDRFASGSSYKSGMFNDGSTNFTDFTTFTIVFSSNGRLVRQVAHGGNMLDVTFTTTEAVFTGTGKVWESVEANANTDGGENGEQGTAVITMFNYTELLDQAEGNRDEYLKDYGQFLPTNYYTGQLFQRR